MESQNYKVSVELTALPGARVMRSKDGKLSVDIPIEQADLFVAENGKVWLSLDLWAKKGGLDQYGKSHGVKASISKERGQNMSKDERLAMPFIGSAKPFSTNRQEHVAPATATANDDDRVPF